ncbi:MAG TPA: type II secretion system protein GspJ [Leucothrix sp.]|nr:type II secretion system protein GspJ [Leucothrix sp.]
MTTLSLLKNKSKNKQQGFTLIELLVSMMIFSLMSVMAYSGLINIFKSNEVITAQEVKLKTLKRSVMFFERDMRQLVLRRRSAGFGQSQGAFLYGLDSEGLLEFTRAGNSNPMDLTRSTLQRVRYELDDKKLIRLSWNLVDHLDAEPVKMTLLEDVDSFTLRMLSIDGAWKDNWGAKAKNLPKAVELMLEHKYWGKIKRIIPVD